MQNPTQTDNALPPTASAGGDIHLIDLLIVLAQAKERILLWAFVGAALAVGASMLIKDSFTGRAQILPLQSQSNSSALIGQLGALGGLAGSSVVKGQSDTYVAILNSRRVADALILRFRLQEVYGTRTATETRALLQKDSVITAGKDGLLTIEVASPDAKLAADLSNAYVEELQKLTQIFAITEASQRRLFFDKQVQQAKQGLAAAEVALKEMQEESGLIQLTGQAEGVIRAAAALQAQIASKEVALGAMRTFATSQNPQFVQMQQELQGLRSQLSKVETGISSGKGDIAISTTKVPAAGLEYMRRVREVKYFESIYEMLSKQFEVAKIDEAKEGSLVQVLDQAVVPDKKTKPNRLLIVLFGLFGGAISGLMIAFLKESSKRIRSSPENSMRLERLRQSRKWIRKTL